MRDWTKPLLVLCVIALGSGLFILERRISDLEARLAARSGIASATSSTDLGAALAIQGDAVADAQPNPEIIWRSPAGTQHADILRHEQLRRQGIQVTPPAQNVPAPRLQRTPSGEINGVPYYILPLGDSEG